jgi:hypothetical protein
MWLEQRHEEESILAHAIAKTDSASAGQYELSPFRCAIQLVKVAVDFQHILQVCAIIHPILNDKLVLAYKWLQLCVNSRYRELVLRIQSLE